MGESMTDTTQYETKSKLQLCEVELKITDYAWRKLMAYCRATDLEVSGFMLMEREGQVFKIKDAYIVDQESTSTSTEMASTAIAKLQMELFKAKIIGHDENVKLAHFHTHPTFNVFWSGTDMILRRTMVAGCDYSLALVINQKGEALAALDINGEFPMSIDHLPISIEEEPDELAKACAAEVKAKVKQPQSQWQYAGDGMGHARYLWRDQDGDLKTRAYPGGEFAQPDASPVDEEIRKAIAAKLYVPPEKYKTEGNPSHRRRVRKDFKRWKKGRAALPGLAGQVARFEDGLLGQRQPEDGPPMAAAGDDGIVIMTDALDRIEARRHLDANLAGAEGIWSDSEGTWTNIGGEVVKIAGPNGEDFS